MDKIKKLLNNEKQIIEGLAVSFIGAWALASIIRGAAKKIADIQFVAQSNFVLNILLIVLFGILIGMIYYKSDSAARLLMFASVYLFLILLAVTGNEHDWSTINKNHIGNVCFQGVLCFFAVLTFLYVKEDIFRLFRFLEIDRKKPGFF